MKAPATHRSLALSQQLYRRLLAAYPRAHREEYGDAMAQLFRDQCRDAWAAGRGWGLAALWLRILPDLVKTSCLERWASLHPGKYMTAKLNTFFPPARTPLATFCVVFTVVFLLVFTAAAIITFILPESYASTARIKVETDESNYGYTTAGPADHPVSYDPYFIQTTFEIIQSQLVLSNVVRTLDLNAKWGKRYHGGQPLKTAESMEILKRRLLLQPVRNTKLVTITVYDEDRREAADLANGVAKAYQDYRLQTRTQMMLAGQHALAEQLQVVDEHLDQLQSETAALRQQFGIPENPEQFTAKAQEQLIDGQRTCDALQTQLTQLQGLNPQRLREVLPTVTGDAMLTDLLSKWHATQQAMATLTNDYARTDLHIIREQSALDELNQEIDARVAGIMTALDSEVKSKRAARESLQAAIADAQQKSKPTRENQPYWSKQRELAGQLEFRKTLASKIEAAKLASLTSPASSVEIIDYAQPGFAPVKPNKPLNLALGAIAGVLLGSVAGAIAATLAHRRLRLQPKPAAQA